MRSGNPGKIRSADFDVWDCSQHFARAVPVRSTNLAVNFVKHRVIHIGFVPLPNRTNVGLQRIAGNLIPPDSSASQIEGYAPCIDAVSCSYVMADDEV